MDLVICFEIKRDRIMTPWSRLLAIVYMSINTLLQYRKQVSIGHHRSVVKVETRWSRDIANKRVQQEEGVIRGNDILQKGMVKNFFFAFSPPPSSAYKHRIVIDSDRRIQISNLTGTLLLLLLPLLLLQSISSASKLMYSKSNHQTI